MADLTNLLDGLRSGRADHEGEDPDWLLGLTETAPVSIDATSMTSLEGGRQFVDTAEFWSSDLGQRYLERQRQAIARNVRVRRLFVLTDDAVPPEQLESLLEPHRRITVEIASVALVADPRAVSRRRQRFEALWSAAGDDERPEPAASTGPGG